MSDLLSEALAAIQRPGSFAVRRELPSTHLSLEVRGVGTVPLPISPAKARELCAKAAPAQHGFKDQTLLDKKVRDTWEIPKTRVKIDQRRWKQALVPELDRIRQELGLAAHCELRAELHNLLVYAPGQFFVPHQDSEKGDGMIGTLVVTLPSEFKGGAIVVKHHDEKVEFRGANDSLSLIAFYADCHHEVRPVKSGYRVVLTYNLFLTKAEGELFPLPSPAQCDALAERVREFFETPPPPRWSGAKPEGPPDRLIYLLDYQYSQRGLGWDLLKNGDALRVAALREVAKQLDCEVALALADVHETWSCEDEGYGGRYGRGWRSGSRRYYDYDEDDPESPAGDADIPELIELHDSNVELRHFVDARGKAGAAAGDVSAAELCYTQPSVEMQPFKSEHEGYMGNWGNTVDHWYHRAALVLWPRERTFVIRAKTSAKYALDELLKTLKREGAEATQHKVQQVLPFWPQVWRAANDSSLIDKTLRVALGLDSSELAAQWVLPLRVEHLTVKVVPLLVSLLDLYGLERLEAILEKWHSEGRGTLEPTRIEWLASLHTLSRALMETGSDPARKVAQKLAPEQWKWLFTRYKWTLEERPSKRLKRLSAFENQMLRLIESSLVVGDRELHATMLRFLTSAEFPILALVHLLNTARRIYGEQELKALALGEVTAQCVSELKKRLARPIRANDDWSIAPPTDCKCELCKELSRFLKARNRTTFEWPLAQDKRSHVHGVIDKHELPVSHVTRRSGRPYTLVLKKTPELFAREAKERNAWQKGLDSLLAPPAPGKRNSTPRRGVKKREPARSRPVADRR